GGPRCPARARRREGAFGSSAASLLGHCAAARLLLGFWAAPRGHGRVAGLAHRPFGSGRGTAATLPEQLRSRRPTDASQWLRPGLAELRGQLALGLPIGMQMMLEVGAFSVSYLMIGWIGVTPQAAHQIAINVASVTYMAATGIAA
nr:hypothetical protein [Tanacetum cinerariifolium]